MYDQFFWIDLVYVNERYRGKGLGKLLHQDALKLAKKKGFKKIVIDIFNVNKKSIKFHEKLTFEPIYTIYQKKI